MCFDCSAFQYQLDKVRQTPQGPLARSAPLLTPLQDRPLEDHVFQTIYLNKKHEDTWSKDEIKKDKISEWLRP
jgi:hypothetical protein